jgi:hypothetical protein
MDRAQRRANRRSRSSHGTVGATVMGLLRVRIATHRALGRHTGTRHWTDIAAHSGTEGFQVGHQIGSPGAVGKPASSC